MTRADIVTALESTNTSRRTTQAAGVGITRRRSLLRQSGGDDEAAGTLDFITR
jgi:hypothetical protein